MYKIEKKKNILKGIVVTIIWFMILTPIILIPYFGIICLITICPFIAGYMGGKYFNKNFFIGGVAGLILAIILFIILYEIMSLFASTMINFGAFEISLIALFFLFITIFCGIGSMVSSR